MIYFYFIFKTVRLYKWSNFQTVLVIQNTATVWNAPKMKFKIKFIQRQQNSKIFLFNILQTSSQPRHQKPKKATNPKTTNFKTANQKATICYYVKWQWLEETSTTNCSVSWYVVPPKTEFPFWRSKVVTTRLISCPGISWSASTVFRSKIKIAKLSSNFWQNAWTVKSLWR